MTKALRKDTRFKKGNPGRRPGSRNKATVSVEALLDGDAEKLTRKAIEMALAGDTVAMRLCLDRPSARHAERALSNWNFPKSRLQGMFCKPMRRSLMQWRKVASRQTRLAPSQASWRSSADQSRPVNWKPGLPNWRTLEARDGVKAPDRET